MADKTRVFLGLGSNIGDRRRAMQEAAGRIAGLPATELLRSSALYETEPWGLRDQPLFYNCAVECVTASEPENFHESLKRIEREMGREESPRYHPRLIDIDILFFGDRILSTPSLTLPHPALHERRFVLAPLMELAPEFLHPLLRKTVARLFADCADEGSVRKTGEILELPAAEERRA